MKYTKRKGSDSLNQCVCLCVSATIQSMKERTDVVCFDNNGMENETAVVCSS